MLSTLRTIKNLGILLLDENDKQKNSNDPEFYELSACNVVLKKGSIAYKIDNYIDRGAVTMSDDIANALDALEKAEVINYSLDKSNNLIVCVKINLLRQYLYGLKGDLIDVFTSTDRSLIHKSQSIPVDSFSHIFRCDPLRTELYSDDLLQIGFSLIKLSSLYNSMVFYHGKENLIVELEGAICYLLDDTVSANISPQTLDKDLEYFERHKVLDVEPSMIVLDTFRFYEWFSIMKNQTSVKTSIRVYKDDDDDDF